MCIKIHLRYFKAREAHLELGSSVAGIAKKYNLTYHELVSILLEEAQSWTKYGIRLERHPDDPDKKGDEE